MRAETLKRSISEYSSLLHAQGFVANHDGNVSAKSAEGKTFFITPTALSKRICAPDTIVECTMAGASTDRSARPRHRPPSEVLLHASAYQARPDAHAVVHAHPPYASAFALVGAPIGPIGMPEVVVSLGAHIPLVPRFLPKDPTAAEAVGSALQGADVVALTGNGVLTVGPDLETAYLRLELVEHYAQILTIARGRVGEVSPLTEAELSRLVVVRKKAGLHREAAPSSSDTPPKSAVRAIVAEEVRRALGDMK